MDGKLEDFERVFAKLIEVSSAKDRWWCRQDKQSSLHLGTLAQSV